MPKTYTSNESFEFKCECGKSYIAPNKKVLDRYLRLHTKFCKVDLTTELTGVTPDIRIRPDTKGSEIGDFVFYEK
jgi:hypothetical protein